MTRIEALHRKLDRNKNGCLDKGDFKLTGAIVFRKQAVFDQLWALIETWVRPPECCALEGPLP